MWIVESRLLNDVSNYTLRTKVDEMEIYRAASVRVESSLLSEINTYLGFFARMKIEWPPTSARLFVLRTN